MKSRPGEREQVDSVMPDIVIVDGEWETLFSTMGVYSSARRVCLPSYENKTEATSCGTPRERGMGGNGITVHE
jgi:hypothetical protein